MDWLFLLLAGALEITWALGLKNSDGLTRVWPSTLTLLAIVLSFVMHRKPSEPQGLRRRGVAAPFVGGPHQALGIVSECGVLKEIAQDAPFQSGEPGRAALAGPRQVNAQV